MPQQPYVGIDEIIGAALGGGDELAQLSQLFSGDVAEELARLGLGIDDIIGAAAANAASPQPTSQAALKNLAALRAAGQRGVVNKSAENLKFEWLQIPLTALAAGQSLAITVRPIRSMRIDRVDFDSANVDHQFIDLTAYQILGIEQLNGAGGIRLSQLHEMRTEPMVRGSTAQAGQDILLSFTNIDAVNGRSFHGLMSGPSIRV